MHIALLPNDSFRMELSDEELCILMACINDALELGEGEFQARVGAEPKEAREFLRIMAAARKRANPNL